MPIGEFNWLINTKIVDLYQIIPMNARWDLKDKNYNTNSVKRIKEMILGYKKDIPLTKANANKEIILNCMEYYVFDMMEIY